MSHSTVTTQTLRTAIVGYGRVAGGHLKRLQQHPDCFDVFAVCDMTEARRAAAVEDGIETAFADLDELLAAKPDLVLITTHSSTHYQLAKACLQAGCHVLIEKPVTLDADEAAELFDLARANKVFAYVWHNRRFDDDYRRVKQLVQDKGIGQLLRVENRTAGAKPAVGFGTKDFNPAWRITADMGGGTMWDFGPHWVDQVLDLVPGTVVGVLGQVQNVKWGDADDFFHITMIFDSGVHAVASKVDIAHHSFPKWLVFGSDATVWTEGAVNSNAHWKHDEDEVVLEELPEKPDMALNLYQVLRGEAEPLITMEQSLRTARVLDAARESARLGKQIDVSI